MKYESEILNEITAIEGHTSPSIRYESECIEHAVNEMDEGATYTRHFTFYNLKIYEL